MKFSLSVTLNNTCVLPQHLKCVNVRVKWFCLELPFGDASFEITSGLFGGSGDSKCWEPSSQIREKSCLNKVKTRNIRKQTTFLHLGNGEIFTLREQITYLDVVVALSAVNHVFWMRCWKASKGQNICVQTDYFFIIFFFSYRLFKERALSNFHSCFFSLQDLLQLCDCWSMLDCLKESWQDGIFQTSHPSSTGIFLFVLCSFPFKQGDMVSGFLST